MRLFCKVDCVVDSVKAYLSLYIFFSKLYDFLVILIFLCLFCLQDLAIDATTTVGVDLGQGLREVDIKKYIKVEKIPGGQIEDSKVLKGVMFSKDVVAPGKMRRKILNPRIILLDCPLEYKKGENQTNAELVKEEDWCVIDLKFTCLSLTNTIE